MINSKLVSFLQPDIQQVRKSIIGIDDSYNNQWDVLAELLQNAVDAIRQKYNQNITGEYEGKIDIYINSQTKEIQVADNGLGIDYKSLPELLKPFSSGKDSDSNTIGEKGVGLTFVLFNCNEFTIKTGNEEGSTIGKIKDALNWKISSNNEDLTIDISSTDEKIQGTEVSLKNMEDLEIFQLNNKQMEYLIRTKTAIGSTEKLWNDDINVNVSLKFVDINNVVHNTSIDFSYFNLIENLGPSEKINLDEFSNNFTNKVMKTDKEKRNALKDKIVYKKGSYKHQGNRDIHYFAYFVPTRNAWEILNQKFGLLPQNSDGEGYKNYLEKFYYTKLDSGIFTSVKGMPTGVSVHHPETGNAGYWPNMFILFQDNKLSFDIGRKSIHGGQAKILQKYSREIFNDFTKIMVKFGGRSLSTGGRNWNRDEIFENINEMRKLEYANTSFQKIPTKQEAQVCAMFYEQIGKGNIKNLTLLTSGYKGKYDLYAKIDNKGKVVIEFKSELRNILKDFSDEHKLFDEIDCVVCWDVSEQDKDKFHDLGISISLLGGPSMFSSQDEELPNVTHKMELSGFTKPIYIIDLKVILENLENN